MVCVNEVELAFLSGKPTDTDVEVEFASKLMLQMNVYVMAIIATLGSRGCMMICVKGYDHHNPNTYTRPEVLGEGDYEVVYVKAEEVKAVDTVGAGDSFIGKQCV